MNHQEWLRLSSVSPPLVRVVAVELIIKLFVGEVMVFPSRLDALTAQLAVVETFKEKLAVCANELLTDDECKA